MIGRKVQWYNNNNKTGIIVSHSRQGGNCVIVEWDEKNFPISIENISDLMFEQFTVWDNDRPASSEGYQTIVKGLGWDNHKFDTFDAAVEYARKYLGPWLDEVEIKVNEPINYNGHGDFLVIKEEFVS